MRRPDLGLRRRLATAQAWVVGRLRLALTLAIVAAALACVLAGIALIYVPAALIATGLVLLAGVTLDPAKLGRLTWPR